MATEYSATTVKSPCAPPSGWKQAIFDVQLPSADAVGVKWAAAGITLPAAITGEFTEICAVGIVGANTADALKYNFQTALVTGSWRICAGQVPALDGNAAVTQAFAAVPDDTDMSAVKLRMLVLGR